MTVEGSALVQARREHEVGAVWLIDQWQESGTSRTTVHLPSHQRRDVAHQEDEIDLVCLERYYGDVHDCVKIVSQSLRKRFSFLRWHFLLAT